MKTIQRKGQGNMEPKTLFCDYAYFCEIKRKILCAGKPVVIYCAGFWGKTLKKILGLYGISVARFCDNSTGLQGTEIEGVLVSSYEECIELYGRDAFWIIAHFRQALPFSDQLEADGVLCGERQWHIWSFLNMCLFPEEVAQRMDMANGPVILTGSAGLALRFSECNQLPSTMDKWVYCATPYDGDLSALEGKFEIMSAAECQEEFPDAGYLICYKAMHGLGCQGPRTDKHCQGLKNYLLNEGILEQRLSCELMPWLLWDAVAIAACQPEPGEQIDRLMIGHFDKALYFDMATGACGTFFLDSVLDNHPNILFLGKHPFTANLLFFIWELRGIPREKLPEALKDAYEHKKQRLSLPLPPIWGGGEDDYFDKWEIFTKYFLEATAGREELSDRDIFIAVHIAHFYMLGREYHSRVTPVIYVEAHMNEESSPVTINWLRANFGTYAGCHMARDTIAQSGSWVRNQSATELRKKQAFLTALREFGFAKEYRYSRQPSLVMRFEDLKLYPKETLAPLCRVMDIPWEDTFLQTTDQGKPTKYNLIYTYTVKGYDIKPVFNRYEEYFSSFDRFRLDLLFRERQKAFGYPCIDMDYYGFTTEQIKQWFQLPFKIESLLKFESQEERMAWRSHISEICEFVLNCIEHKLDYPHLFQFGDYIKIKE